MSKKSNVNPDHYKTAGRNPQGHDVVQSVERQKMRQEKAWLDKEAAGHEPAPSKPEKHTPESKAGSEDSSPQRREASTARAREPKRSSSREKDSAGDVVENRERQASSKSGKRASAQKAAGRRHEWRHESEPAPASKKVAGADGKEQPGREPVAAKVEEED